MQHGIGVQIVRPQDKAMLIDAMVKGDGVARVFLCALGATLQEVRRTKGVPCCCCDAIIRPRGLLGSTFCLAWLQGTSTTLRRSVACHRCSEAVDDEALRERAADELNSQLNREFAASHGATFSLTAGRA